jgi:hypothetical protein
LQGIELLPKPSEGESSKLQLVSPDIFSPENFYYTARAVRGSSVLIKGIPADTQYKLTYSPVNAWDNIQSEATLKIKVDGGSNYQSCEYTITLQITEPQNPLFTRITANNVDVELIENQFYYIIEVPKDENSVGVPISYELAMITDVKTVEWSKDGAVWTEDNTKGGISGIILDPDESELVQIRNTCYDNTQAVYALYLTRQEITDDSLVLRDLCYGDFSLTFEELTTVAGFTPTVHNYSVYVTTGADQKVQGELDPKVLEDNPTAKIVYSRDGLTWSNSPPKVQIDLGDAPVSVYVRVKAGGAHNDYVVVLTRDEALYKIDNALGAGLTINGGNSACKVEIEPKSIWEEGVPAGAVVQIIVKPAPGYKIGINDDGGEVGKPQVFTGKPNFYTPFAPSNIDGKVPTNGDAQTFSFCMPKSDIRIKVDFAELKSVSNYLVNLTASDGSGLKIMERFVPTVISNKVVCINNYVFITPTIPVASTLQKKIFDTGNPYVDVPASELINGIRVDMSVLAARILVLQVVPKNSSLSPRTYSVSIIRIEPSDTLYCIDNSKGLTSTVESDKSLPYAGTPQFWKAPITGWYKFEAYGAKGGFAGSKAGGMGGYSYGELYVLKGQTFGVVVGGEGGHPNHVEGGHSDSYSVPGANYGGRGGGSRDWTNGGGGGGRTEIILSGEVVMIAGGGGGASERGNETDGPGGGGGGGGGDGTNSLGGKQDSSALSSTDSCEGQGGDGYFTRSGDGGGGGGLRGGKTKEGHGGAGGSGYVDANVFSNHGGERGTRDGSGMVVITFNGVER